MFPIPRNSGSTNPASLPNQGGLVEYAVICLASLAVSGLTLFSGFGLGTVLTPVMAIFFPTETAVAVTAVVV